MSRLVPLSIRLACRDWLHEFGLSVCGVLALASMLAPLLVLHGVHMGVVERLREHLMRDPAVLVLVPVGSRGAGFDEAFLELAAQQPACRFCVGRIRNVASEVQLRAPDGQRCTVTLEATAPGDPMLERHGVPQPVSTPDRLEIVLTAGASARLKAGVGDRVGASLARRLASGKFQSRTLELQVIGVLPPSATGMDTGFVDMNTLTAVQDFRDGVTSDLLNIAGDLPAVKIRHFESFRAYARSLDEVGVLEEWFAARDVAVKTRSRDIANIRHIDATLSSVIMLIACAACAGLFAFMASTAQAAVRRKWKMMGMLRLIGFTRFSLLLYPVVQALVTGGLGCLLAFSLYGMVAHAIDAMFSAQTGGEAICTVSFAFLCLTFGCIQLLALLASLWAARSASAIEPSAVLRQS